MRTFRLSLSALWLAALVVVLGCSRPAETVRTHDLLRLLPRVPHGAEVTALDIGTPGAEPFAHGLSWNDQTEDGTTFSWSDGPTTTFDFFVTDPRPARLELRGLPWPGATDAGGQSIELAWNGRALATLAMDGTVQELSATLPVDNLVPGRNRLELTYGVLHRPAEGDEDQRALGAAWDWIRLAVEPLGEPAASPFGDLLRDRLQLPAGSWIEFDLEIEPETELVFDRIAGDADLVVTWIAANERSSGSDRFSAGRRLRSVLQARGSVLLTFTNPGPGALRLESPRLEARRTPN